MQLLMGDCLERLTEIEEKRFYFETATTRIEQAKELKRIER